MANLCPLSASWISLLICPIRFDEQGKIINPTTNNNPRIKQLKSVKGITVNTINAEAKRIERIKSLFAPDTESMEGAAFFYACLKKKIPCFQLRTISNYIEPRNLNNWNIPFAIANLTSSYLKLSRLSEKFSILLKLITFFAILCIKKVLQSKIKNHDIFMSYIIKLGFSPCPNDTFIFRRPYQQ
jgi:hypothetical protein